jgi:hypothetical protein
MIELEESPYRLLVQDLRTRLADAAGADGGWGYYAGHASRLEPTCWATTALAASDPSGVDSRVASHLSFLRSRQQASGFLVDAVGLEPNYAWNGLALFTLHGLQNFADKPSYDRLMSALLSAKGVQLPPDDPAIIRQDSRLQAWSWIGGTFSWVEPTSWCLLALKKIGSPSAGATARISEAETLLINRVCHSGGWNYGNSNVFTQDLRPYVPTTALALLALQDRRDKPDVERSLSWLEGNATTERSAMALALSAVCLHVFKRPVDRVLALIAAQDANTKFLGNAHLVAMALYAITIPQHGAALFRLST